MTKTTLRLVAVALVSALAGGGLGYYWWSEKGDEVLTSETPVRLEAISPAPAERLAASGEQQARNLVLLIGDGMGFSHLTAARALVRGAAGRLTVERFPVSGWAYTHSARHLSTDSGAGASALSTGVRTFPGALGVDAEGESIETIFEVARDAGKAVGVITDSVFFDATPAAFLAHRETRRDTFGVIGDMAASGADLIVGETREPLEAMEEWGEALAEIEGRGFTVARSLADLRAAGEPVLGLFPKDHIALGDREPTLVELTSWAIERLGERPEGFVLMVETEETDTASHGGDLERMVRGVAALDAVAELLVERFAAAGDTLVVVTADHETGGLALFEGTDGKPLSHRWATHGHTAEPVPVLAWGPGSGSFAGVHDNFELAGLLAAALGLDCCGRPAAEPAPPLPAAEPALPLPAAEPAPPLPAAEP